MYVVKGKLVQATVCGKANTCCNFNFTWDGKSDIKESGGCKDFAIMKGIKSIELKSDGVKKWDVRNVVISNFQSQGGKKKKHEKGCSSEDSSITSVDCLPPISCYQGTGKYKENKRLGWVYHYVRKNRIPHMKLVECSSVDEVCHSMNLKNRQYKDGCVKKTKLGCTGNKNKANRRLETSGRRCFCDTSGCNKGNVN